MKWYYSVLGAHTHVRVFMNGGKCGDLCFRNEEFNSIRDGYMLPNIPCGAVRVELIEDVTEVKP